MSKIIYTDGASKGNPGPSSIGIICFEDETEKKILFQHSEQIGHATNNIAEWTALLKALEMLIQEKILTVKIFLDSELVVKQFKGEYKTKNPELIEIKNKVLNLKKSFTQIIISHIPREKNKHADRLANDAFKK